MTNAGPKKSVNERLKASNLSFTVKTEKVGPGWAAPLQSISLIPNEGAFAMSLTPKYTLPKDIPCPDCSVAFRLSKAHKKGMVMVTVAQVFVDTNALAIILAPVLVVSNWRVSFNSWAAVALLSKKK